MPDHRYFELHRLIDGLIYQFDRRPNENGKMFYRRRDQDLWITYKNDFGWVAWDEPSQSLAGRPWNVLPQAQNPDHPPEGEWVSKKGSKSYVYELRYCAIPPEK